MHDHSKVAVASAWLVGLVVACTTPGVHAVDEAPENPTGIGTKRTAQDAGAADARAPEHAPLEMLRLSRVAMNGAERTIAVTRDDGDSLEGVDLGALLGEDARYPLDLVTKYGFAELADAVDSAPRVTIARAALVAPIREGSAQVNAAENYAEHQAETGAAQTMPFLFPKVAEPTGPDETVQRRSGDLLDYEVELCVAFGRDITKQEDLVGAPVGFVLCNDVSDRAAQVLGLDPNDTASGKGFTDGKSRTGFLPLGPYLVVARNPRAFLSELTLSLRVNGEKRQEDSPKNMIWDIERLVKEALAAGKTERFVYGGKPLALLPEGKLAKGTLIVSGTPGGIILKAPEPSYKVLKAAEWVAKGGFLTSQTVEQYVQAAFVADLRASGKFLKPGDVIEGSATFLGSHRITIAGAAD